MLCLGIVACGNDETIEEEIIEEEIVDDGIITIEELHGYWYPVEGLGQTTSVLTSIFVDANTGTWEEYDIYGELTGYTGKVYTDGEYMILSDVPLIGEVEIPIQDADTLVDDEGNIYWVKGYPDYQEKPQLSQGYYGKWYLRGDHDSDFKMVLTLNEDGTYMINDYESGTFEYDEINEYDENDNVTLRKRITLSSSMTEMYYLLEDGQVLSYWADHGDNYYIHESALENIDLLKAYQLTNGNFSGENYIIEFKRDHSVTKEYLGEDKTINGTWEVIDEIAYINWEDGESDEVTIAYKEITLGSTGETLKNPW